MAKPKKPCAFAIVRKAVGLSQQKFAEVVGITKAAVENIELRRGRISDDLAHRVGALAGAVPWTLAGDDPRDFSDKPYSRDSFKRWNDHEYKREKNNELIATAREYLAFLLEASLAKGHASRTNRFRAILMEFNRFVFAQVRAHGLKDALVSLLQEHYGKVESGKEMSVRAAKMLLGKTRGWKTHARRRWKPNTKVRYSVQCIPQFVPFVAFWKPDDDSTPGFIDGMSTVRYIYDLEIEGEPGFRVVKDIGQIDMTVSGDFPVRVATPPSKRSSRQRQRKA
jgi:transcriptional regulator with XRE-family HTH domain